MRIEHLTVQQKRLSSAEAELLVFAQIEEFDANARLGGCLVGPYCTGVETVQINYPLKPITPPGIDEGVLVGQFVIPEPNLWTPEMPFVYEGNVELWELGKCSDTWPLRAAFKAKLNAV